MKFIQVMEFKSTIEEAQKGLEEYIEVAGSKTTARVVTICVDRDDPETIIQIIEFDSMKRKNLQVSMKKMSGQLLSVILTLQEFTNSKHN